MRIMIRKSVLLNLFNKRLDEENNIEKAHKYIRRFMGKNGEYIYIYPKNVKSNSRNAIKKELVAHTPLINGIQPLSDFSEEEVNYQFNELTRLSNQGKLTCTALGRDNILINEMSYEHTQSTNGDIRELPAKENKLKYLPFIPEILKHGKLVEKSRNKGKVTYGIGGKVQYFDKEKKKNVIDFVEIAIAYDEQANKYYLSSASKPIKKSFTDFSIKDFSQLISYVFEY